MTIEVALVVSVVSVSLAFCFGFATWKRNKSHDDKSDASELTTVIVSLENIKDGIKDILTKGRGRVVVKRIETIENKIIGKG